MKEKILGRIKVMNPILVVDDNEQILNILTQYINKEGWALLTAKTGEEALSLFDAAQPHSSCWISCCRA